MKAYADRKGFGIVEILAGISMVSLLMLAFSKVLNTGTVFARSLELKTDLDAGRRLVLKASCENTLPQDLSLCPCEDIEPLKETPAIDYKCPDNAYFSLRNASGLEIMKSDGTTYGEWSYRFSCTKTKFVAERAKFGGEKFAKDPVSKQQLSWYPLFPGKTPVCADVFGPENPKNNGDKNNTTVYQATVNSTDSGWQCEGGLVAGPGGQLCNTAWFKLVYFPKAFSNTPNIVVGVSSTFYSNPGFASDYFNFQCGGGAVDGFASSYAPLPEDMKTPDAFKRGFLLRCGVSPISTCDPGNFIPSKFAKAVCFWSASD